MVIKGVAHGDNRVWRMVIKGRGTCFLFPFSPWQFSFASTSLLNSPHVIQACKSLSFHGGAFFCRTQNWQKEKSPGRNVQIMGNI